MNSWIVWAFGIAFAFSIWPILGKASGAGAAWVGTLVVSGSLITTLFFGAKEMVSGPMFTTKALLILVVAGLVNGVAVYYYSSKSIDPAIPTGAFITTTVVLMAMMSPLLDYAINGNALSAKQWLGIGTAMLTVYLLKG